MSDRDATYLQHIATAIEKIDTCLRNLDEEQFNGSIAEDAVIRNLEVISEASRRLSSELKERHPAMKWAEIAAAGNVYRHQYESVQSDIIWVTATSGLDGFRDVIRRETNR